MSGTTCIAVVDDDEATLEAMAGLIRTFGYRVVAFSCAEDFLAFGNRVEIGCLIADMQMPGMTGLDLHARLVVGGETTPTILITAFPDQGARTRALKAGVKSYLTKPVSCRDLHACIQSALGSGDPCYP